MHALPEYHVSLTCLVLSCFTRIHTFIHAYMQVLSMHLPNSPLHVLDHSTHVYIHKYMHTCMHIVSTHLPSNQLHVLDHARRSDLHLSVFVS
jgi:hypothetical protein